MKKPGPSWLSQPLYPNSAQQQALRRHWTRALSAQHVLSSYLTLRAAGHGTRLLDVAVNPETSPGPPAPGDTVVVPPFTLAELQTGFRQARDALGWPRDVPASVYHQIIVDTARDWRAFSGGPFAPRSCLPPGELNGRGSSISTAQPSRLDETTLEVASLYKGALVLGDLYLPPAALKAACPSSVEATLAAILSMPTATHP